MWTAAILAGGRARRLGGRDKSALRVGGRTILERQLAVLGSLTPHVLLVGGRNDDLGEIGPSVRMVRDALPDAGALGGIYTALVEAPTEQVLVLACDMPFVSASFLSTLASLGANADAAIPRDERGRHPLCASYHRRVADRLKKSIQAGKLRITDAVGDLDVHDMGPEIVARFDSDGMLLTNINTPEDYERAVLAVDRMPPPA